MPAARWLYRLLYGLTDHCPDQVGWCCALLFQARAKRWLREANPSVIISTFPLVTYVVSAALDAGSHTSLMNVVTDGGAVNRSWFGGRADTCYASTLDIEQRLPEVDLVIGAVLVHGARAPHVVTREQLGLMQKHAVLVDVSIDQGGCFETSRPTTHTDPTYEVDGVTHYCVANMPGAVPITSTFALTNATMPYVVKLADDGVHAALKSDPGFLEGLNVAAGEVTYAPVAADQGLTAADPLAALAKVPAIA